MALKTTFKWQLRLLTYFRVYFSFWQMPNMIILSFQDICISKKGKVSQVINLTLSNQVGSDRVLLLSSFANRGGTGWSGRFHNSAANSKK
eukprot:1626757-Ditylum_brightwellii.AAC.1